MSVDLLCLRCRRDISTPDQPASEPCTCAEPVYSLDGRNPSGPPTPVIDGHRFVQMQGMEPSILA